MQPTSSQQFSIKSANPNNSPYSLLLYFLFLFFFPQQVILFLQLFVCAYDFDKQQTVQNTYGKKKGICERTRIQSYIYICLATPVAVRVTLNPISFRLTTHATE
jgi:hypothetical protein